jgi:ribonuclease Z
MHSKLSMLTLPTADTPGTLLLLHFDTRRYLFGQAAEGLQRALVQRNVSIRHAADVFLTGKAGWQTLGGLMGFTITMADAMNGRKEALEEVARGKLIKAGNGNPTGGDLGVEQVVIKVHGPPNTLHAMGSARRFIFRHGGGVVIDEVKVRQQEEQADEEEEMEPTWKDENIMVWTVEVSSSNSMPTVAFNSNSKKRTFTESEENDAHDQRQQIVNKMFGSNWRKDRLIPIALKDVPWTVRPLWVRDPVSKDLKEYTGPRAEDMTPLPDPDAKVFYREPWPASRFHQLPATSPRLGSVCYFVGTYPTRGKFLPKKAIDLGVPSGPAFRTLTLGETYTTPDGRVITPEMVMEDSRPGTAFGVMDVPGTDHLDDLLQRPEWRNKKLMEKLKLVVWIAGPGVVGDARLQEFITKMKDVKHVFSSPDVLPNRLSFDSSAALNKELNMVVGDVYQMPMNDTKTVPQQTLLTDETAKPSLPENAIVADLSFVAGIKPTFDLRSEPIPPMRQLYLTRKAKDLSAKAKAENLAHKAKHDRWRSQLAIPEAEIIALGTGSSLPSKYRNVSGTLVRVPGHYSYLLDCGENTIGQLQRMYSKEELIQVLKELRMIWISHGHADHHLGTINVIKAWYQHVHANKAPKVAVLDHHFNVSEHLPPPTGPGAPLEYLPVISGNNLMFQFLKEFSSCEDYGFSRTLNMQLEAATLDHTFQRVLSPSQLRICRLKDDFTSFPAERVNPIFGLQSLTSVPVLHCVGARGLAFRVSKPNEPSTPGMLVSFSGDCRPSRALAKVSEGADVLIHEATFGSELQGMAVAKKHSTVDEAVCAAEAMGAKSIVLTHWSQRYQNLVIIHEGYNDVEAKKSVDGKGGIKAEAFQRLKKHELMGKTGEAHHNGAHGHVEEQDVVADQGDLVTEGEVQAVAKETGSSKVKIRDSNLKVCAAFDLMRIKVGQICEMEAYNGVLAQYFEDRDGKDRVEEAEGKSGASEAEKGKKQQKQHKGKKGKDN